MTVTQLTTSALRFELDPQSGRQNRPHHCLLSRLDVLLPPGLLLQREGLFMFMYKQVPVLILFHRINIHDTSKWEMHDLTIQQLALLQKNTLFIINIYTLPPNFTNVLNHFPAFLTEKSSSALSDHHSVSSGIIQGSPLWPHPAEGQPPTRQCCPCCAGAGLKLPIGQGRLDSKDCSFAVSHQRLKAVMTPSVTGRKGTMAKRNPKCWKAGFPPNISLKPSPATVLKHPLEPLLSLLKNVPRLWPDSGSTFGACVQNTSKTTLSNLDNVWWHPNLNAFRKTKSPNRTFPTWWWCTPATVDSPISYPVTARHKFMSNQLCSMKRVIVTIKSVLNHVILCWF